MSRGWSPARALVWESLRLSWRPVLGTTVLGCAFAAMYRRMLEPLGERRDALVFSSLLMTMLVVHAMTLLSCRDDRLGIGFEPRLYRLPLRTALIVSGRLLPALLFVALMQAAVSGFMRGTFGVPWPFWGPCLLAVAVASWTLALTWAFGRRPVWISPFGLVLLALLLLWIRPLLRADPLWSRLAVRDAAILVLATVLASVVAAWGVVRSRSAGSGPALPLSAALRGAGVVPVASSATAAGDALFLGARASSPARAQLWMEWHEKGRLVVNAALLSLGATVAACSIPTPETARLLSGALHFLPMMLLVLPPIAGSLHGPFDVSRRISGIDPFRAASPVGDRELAHVILFAAARAAAAGWAVTVAGVTTLVLLLWRFGDGAQVEELVRGMLSWVERVGASRASGAAILVLLVAWAMLGIVSAATLCGRAWVVTVGYVLPSVGVSAVVVADNTSFELLARGFPVAVASFGIALPLVTIAAWAVAIRGRLLSLRAAVLAAAIGAGGTALLVRLLPGLGAAFGVGEPWPPSLLLAAPGIVASVLLPHALAPLALRWNRHR